MRRPLPHTRDTGLMSALSSLSVEGHRVSYLIAKCSALERKWDHSPGESVEGGSHDGMMSEGDEERGW